MDKRYITEKKKKEYLKLLLKICNELNRRPSYKEINNCLYTPSSMVYKYNFGSVTNALEIVKPVFSKPIPRKKYTNNDLIKEFYRVKKLVGGTPTFLQMKEYGKYHPCIIQYRFNSWKNFLDKLNEKISRRFVPTFKNRKRVFIAKDGHICHSKREIEIDNILYELGIEHSAEINYPFDDEYNKNGRKRCDWQVGDTYVEYAGMLNYYDIVARKKYSRAIDDKFNMCIKNNWNFLVFTPDKLDNIRKDIINEFKMKGGKE